MRLPRLTLVLALSVVSLTPCTARADDSADPPRGVPFLVAGGILTGLGSGTLVTSLVYCPLHSLSESNGSGPQSSRSDPGVCIATMLGIGGVVIVGGIFLLAHGVHQRRIYDQWRLNYGAATHDPLSYAYSPTIQTRNENPASSRESTERSVSDPTR
jgi:hypothetical protein